jgi:hypothetical protein
MTILIDIKESDYMATQEEETYDGDDDENDVETISDIVEYDITASPNDFNVRTIFDFINSGIMEIPGFQRNYVWDKKRASKFVESLIIGIPVPQVFLYEKERNKFSVIDGQQRLLSIYYFMKSRFPIKEKLAQIRREFDKENNLSDKIISNNDFFKDFELRLDSSNPNTEHPLNGQKYTTLDTDYKKAFEYRTIRCIVVRQNRPEKGHGAMYEIFSRLNTGGINLTPQEIRVCVYESQFYNMLRKINLDSRWRNILGKNEPDLHMKDLEILLRSLAMLAHGDAYRPSMVRFLNSFSNEAVGFNSAKIDYFQALIENFLNMFVENGHEKFAVSSSGRFNISIFEAVFYAACKKAYDKNSLEVASLSADKLSVLRANVHFINATEAKTSDTKNVKTRLQMAMGTLL